MSEASRFPQVTPCFLKLQESAAASPLIRDPLAAALAEAGGAVRKFVAFWVSGLVLGCLGAVFFFLVFRVVLGLKHSRI